MTTARVFQLLLLSLTVAACGKNASRATDGQEGEGASSPSGIIGAGASRGVSSASPLAVRVNAKAPAGSSLTFDSRTVSPPASPFGRGSDITVVAPAGWTVEDPQHWPGTMKSSNSAFASQFSVGTDCDGSCVPKDWNAVIDALMTGTRAKSAFAAPKEHLIKDEPLPNQGRIRWGKDGHNAWVYAAWYRTGANYFHYCAAKLEAAEHVAALDAFVEACKTKRFDFQG